MPTSYTTGTINQPNSGAVGQALADKIRDDVVAHAAWDLVEEFTPASGQVNWTVLKCLGSANGLGSDFYVVIGRTLANGELRMSVCEDYNAASHTMSRYGTSSVVSGTVMDAFGRLPGATTYILGTAPFSGASNSPGYIPWIPSGTSTKWWIIAADDTMTVAMNGSSNGFFHMGVYAPLDNLGNTFPVQMTGSGANDTYITRNPAVAGATLNSYGYALRCSGGGSMSPFSYSVPLGFEGQWQFNDKLQANQRAVAELGMTMQTFPGQSDWATVYGFALGKQKRQRRSNNAMPGGFSFGDAFAMNGTLWVPWRPDYGHIFDTGVASS